MKKYTKELKVPHGTARTLRRKNIVKFKSDRRAREQQFTGTILVNAPSLQMLGKFIGSIAK